LSKFKPTYRENAVTPAPPKPVRRTAFSETPAALLVPEPLVTSENQPAASPGSDPGNAAGNAFQRIGFNALLLYIFFRFSFLHEFISNKLNVDTHIIISLSLICALCCLLSGHLFEAFHNKVAWLWISFGAFMCIATATSFWRGGSFLILMDYLRTTLPLVVMIPALTVTKKDLGRLINVIGFACVTTVFLGLINNDFKTGRMSIDALNSEIQDSNDYAAHLILMLPALAYLTMRPGRSMFYKGIGVALMGASMFEILSTGSRGGLLSLGITALYIAFTASHKLRVGILIGVPILALAAIPFIPQESAARLKTLFSSNDNPKAEEATESSQARIALLQESWKITLQHPLSGIGPGEFMDAQADRAKSAGQRGMWHVTHNAYTQVSSECGLPAAIFYLAAVAFTFQILWRGRKSVDRDFALKCSVLNVMMVGFAVCIFFLSQAYNIQFLTLGGAAIVVNSMLQREQHSTSAVVAQPG
jgi:hypothetical protein